MNGFKRTVIGLWVLCVGSLLLGSMSATAGGATDTVKRASDRMIKAFEGQRAALERNPARIYGLVDQILVPHFDFEKITRAAVGKHWGKATPAQQRALTQGFQQMLIRTYAKALLNYSNQEIRYLPEKTGPKSTTVVSAEVRESGANPIPISYKLHKKGGAWKVYDVKINNVSLVSNYRGSFDAEIRRNGIDALISRLSEINSYGLKVHSLED